jgi:phospholipid transport system substrate-binding protein
MKRMLHSTILLAGLTTAIPAFAQMAGANMADERGTSAHASTPAESFVAENITKGLAILNNPALTGQQRSQQFEVMLLNLADMKRIAIFTLGQYAKTASEADQDAFVAAFQSYSEAVYRSYFNRFGGQQMIVTGSSQRAPDDFIVTTKMIDRKNRAGEAPVLVDFRVRTDSGKPVVTDLGIMGVWLAISERDQFGSYLSAHGGSVAALTDNVRSVTARFH